MGKKGTDVSILSRDKGTTGQAQNLATSKAGIITFCPVQTQDRTWDRKIERKKNYNFPLFNILWWQSDSDLALGRPKTEEFVPEFLILPLSRDKGTLSHENVLFLGSPVPLETLYQMRTSKKLFLQLGFLDCIWRWFQCITNDGKVLWWFNSTQPSLFKQWDLNSFSIWRGSKGSWIPNGI